MSVKDNLTNEAVSKHFDNPFSLVNYAIQMAQKMISKGDIGSSHLASDILELIADGQDAIEMAALDYEPEIEIKEETRSVKGMRRSERHAERVEILQ